MRTKPRGPAAGDAPATLVDRLGCAAFSGILSLGLGTVLWLLLNGILGFGQPFVPFRYVEWFAAAMAVLGFALCDNVIASVVGWMFEVLLGLGRWLP